MRAEESAQWPDAETLGNQAIAALPLPTSVKVIKINPSVIRLDTKDAARKPAEAINYNQLWPHLATKQGLISDVFTRLHAAIPRQIRAPDMRAAVMGFALTRQILTATNWDRHQLAAFIIVLGTLRRNRQITPQIWERILLEDDMRARRSGADAHPLNTWEHLRRFGTHSSNTGTGTFGITFVYPNDNSQPWCIRTEWNSDDVVRILRRVRPSAQNLEWLYEYADAYIRSRAARGPIRGISHPEMPENLLYTAPYITAARYHAAFTDENPEAEEPTIQPMEVDDENTSASTVRQAKPAPPK
jgi:hypothetical protein